VVLAIIAGLLFWFLRVKRSRQRSSEDDRLGFIVADDHSGTPPSSSGPQMGDASLYNLSPFPGPEDGSSRLSLGVGVGSSGIVIGLPSTVSGGTERQHDRKASQNTFESSDLTTLVTPTSRGRSWGESVPSPNAMRTSLVQHEDVTPGVNQRLAIELPPAYSLPLAPNSQVY
jgi:hypothetical protein